MPYFSGPNGIREVADPGERFMAAYKELNRPGNPGGSLV